MMLTLFLAMDPDSAKVIGIVFLMLGAIAGAVVYPIARAYARRLEGAGAGAALREELAEVHARLDELQRGQARVAELEERLDFAERMLARPREGTALRPGEDGR